MTAPALVRYRSPILLALAIYIVLELVALPAFILLGEWWLVAALVVFLVASLGTYDYVKDYKP